MVRFIRALCNIAIAGSSCYIRGAFLQDRNGTMLTFTEEILLLLLGEEDGAFLPVNSNAFECALAGATLMDLALPLPAQMFRFGAEAVADETEDFSYSLLSLHPINKKNGPGTDLEQQGLQHVMDNEESFYDEEELGGQRYFAAVYPDFAVSEACVDCHNNHKDSPRTDIELGDVIGGVVIRIPME